MTWANRAAANNPAYNTVNTKAEILRKLNKNKEADEAYAAILNFGSYIECIAYITGLVQQKSTEVDNVVSKINSRYPDIIGRTYLAVGNSYKLFKDNVKAEENYNKGLQTSQDEEMKKRLAKAIEDLKAVK